MTLTGLLQLYAPLAGMLALAFYVGVLSERVKGLKGDVVKLQGHHFVADAPAVVRLTAKVDAMEITLGKVVRGMDGVQRQLGNLMSGRPGAVEFGAGPARSAG